AGVEETDVAAPIGDRRFEIRDSCEHEARRADAAERRAAHEQRIAGAVVDDRCVRGRLSIAARDLYLDAAVRQLRNAVRCEDGVELLLFAASQREREIEHF